MSYHLRIQSMTVPVTNVQRSVDFFKNLAFRVVHQTVRDGALLTAVAPRDGQSVLLLVEDGRTGRLGTPTGIGFVTDDLDACYRDWTARGVRFANEPMSFGPGIRGAFFFDPDGNGFGLAELDIVTRRLEDERQQAAARAEAERRAEFELGIAAQIQAGLFPRHRPAVATLDYTGVCIQAQQVGGDYFDFLGADGQRFGLVVGDVSGKGIGAALLMASLQATFRNQYAHYASDLPALLASVNETFLANSPAPSYVSLFLASYDDTTRQLQFVNGGHPPPVLLRASGQVEMLEATAGVLGMFEQWSGQVRAVQLHPGDVLAIYTDGVTEASGADDVEFGVARLIDALRASGGGSVKAQQDAVLAAVRKFGAGAPGDDITLLLARCQP